MPLRPSFPRHSRSGSRSLDRSVSTDNFFQLALRQRLGRLLSASSVLAGCVALSACATQAQTSSTHRSPDAAATLSNFERDREAILSMRGEYKVRFAFEETVVLKSGYERRKGNETDAFETVILVEDGSRKISLQHLLVSEDGGHVTKHWRQDWTYEAPSRLEFTEAQTWRIKPLAAAVTAKAWTQCVYEVSDAPRYCGTGRWIYQDGVATWTSDRSWRPLPRREYTTRDDYNAVDAENRHTITPQGWTHEQDNTKTIRSGERKTGELVREFGFNDYRRVSSFDFSPAYNYWKGTQAYWAQVRKQWQTRIAASQGIHLKTSVDGMALISPLFLQAEAAQSGKTVGDDSIAAVFDQWTAAVPPSTSALFTP